MLRCAKDVHTSDNADLNDIVMCQSRVLCLVCERAQAPQRLVRTDHRSNTIDKYFFLESQRSSQSPAKELQQSSQEAPEVEISSLSEDEGDDADNVDRSERKSSKKRKRTDESSQGSCVTLCELYWRLHMS